MGEAILKNSAGRGVALRLCAPRLLDISLGFESTEYDRVSYHAYPGDANSAIREKIITLDGYFEPVAQALINSSSPHLNIWGGGLDRPEFFGFRLRVRHPTQPRNRARCDVFRHRKRRLDERC